MSDEDDLARRARGIGALAEPVRRALYRYVVGQAEPVSRDAVAAGVGLARHVAKFHLDRLVADGLLEARFQRLTGRTGPGAGRPAKLYSRASAEVAVSLPERRYDLAGALMAAAIETSTRSGVPVDVALLEAAARHGAAVGALAAGAGPARPGGLEADDDSPARDDGRVASRRVASRRVASRRDDRGDDRGDEDRSGEDRSDDDRSDDRDDSDGDDATPDRLLRQAAAVLAEQGYEPRVSGREVVLANCPFHALVADHTELVCRMNLALLDAVGGSLGPRGSGGDTGPRLTARLDPAPGRCCVVLSVR